MKQQRIQFQNKDGQLLSGRLELPADRHPHNFALFAHCFTCTKNLSAVRNVSRALTSQGFGVLRFDFTGLGESEGDFSDTNFSGNVEDLIAASAYLEEHYQAPSLIIGHSLGGAAAIFAAHELPSIRAVSTIGAPSHPVHVKHLFQNSMNEIEQTGLAEVKLDGRPFTIKKQFIDDLETKSLPDSAKALRKPLLIFHAPQDRTVGIENAEALYKAAHHPKSFITLDGADHLLSDKQDSRYVGEVISSWAARYLVIPEEPKISTDHHVVASLAGEDAFTTTMKMGRHYMIADEPGSVGGHDFGPSPYEFVSAGLAACTAMTLQMYARRKKWDLEHVEVHISHTKELPIAAVDGDEKASKIDTFRKEIKIEGDFDDQQITRLLEIADKCPVHKTLHNDVQVLTTRMQ